MSILPLPALFTALTLGFGLGWALPVSASAISTLQKQTPAPTIDASALVDQAFEHLGEGRFREAAGALQLAGDDTTAHYLLGCIHEYGSLGRTNLDAAREHHAKAARGHCPEAVRAMVRLSRLPSSDGGSTKEVQRWLYEAFKLGDERSALELAEAFGETGRAGDASSAIAWARIASTAKVEGAEVLQAMLEGRFPRAVKSAGSRQRLIEAKLERDRRSIDGVVQVQVPLEMFLPAGAQVQEPAAPSSQGGPQGAVRMTKVPLRDELMENMDSHTMLLPDGWDLSGGVTWNPLSTWAYVSVDARAAAPDGRHVQFLPNGAFTYYEGTQYPGAPQPPQIGQMTGGKMFMPPGQGPTDFLAKTLFPAYHPEATGFQIVSVGEVEEVAKQYRQMFAPLIQQAEQMNRQGGMSGGMRTSVNVGVPMIRVRYTEGGRAFEEQFTFMYYLMSFGGDMGMGMSMYTYDWSVYDVRGLRAPAGQLDSSIAMLHTVSTSLRPTRPWKAIVDEIQKQVIRNQQEISRMQHQTNMENLAALRKRGEILRRTNAEIMESNQKSWEASQASQDRVARAWSNTMLEVDDYALPDGSVRSLDSNYRNVYTANGDVFLFTDDDNLNPNIGSTVDWQKIEPITPMGGAANR